MQTIITDILSEEFEMPVYNADLEELIMQAVDYYNDMPYCRSTTRQYRKKLNELIAEYNERRNMKIFNNIK